MDAPRFLDFGPIGGRLRLNSAGEPDEYEACPDADVFDWDEARIKVVESYETSGLDLTFTIWKNYRDDLEIKRMFVKARRVQLRLLNIDRQAASILQDAWLQEVRHAVSAQRSYNRRYVWLGLLFLPIWISSMAAAILVSLWVNSNHGWWLLLL